MIPDYQRVTEVAVASCADVSVTEQPNKKDLLNFSKSFCSYWVRESNPYCKIENLEY